MGRGFSSVFTCSTDKLPLSDEQENSYRKVITSELVLIEGKNKEGKYEGYSQHYLKYEFESDKDLTGTFVKI